MKLRTFLLCSVVVSIVAIATILYVTGTRDTPQAADTTVPQPSATASPGSTPSDDKSASIDRASVEPEDAEPPLDARIKVGNEDLLTEADRAEVKRILPPKVK